MFRVKSLIYKQDVFQQKLLKEDNPRAKRPLWHLLQVLPLNSRSAGFGTGLSLTLNLPPLSEEEGNRAEFKEPGFNPFLWQHLPGALGQVSASHFPVQEK